MPLFLIYEIGVFTISSSNLPLLRNGADVLMRQLLEVFGIYGVYGFSGTFLFKKSWQNIFSVKPIPR